MSEIRNVILSLSVTLIFFGAVSMLVPEGNMAKAFNLFRSVAIVAAVAMSVVGVSKAVSQFDFTVYESSSNFASEELSQKLDVLNLDAVSAAVRRIISDTLEKENILNTEISVFANKTEDNSIRIVKVQVVCDKKDTADCRELITQLGFEVEISERE